MKKAKFIVMYPTPTNVVEFEKRYIEEHVPMAVERLGGKIAFEATQVASLANGQAAPFHRIAEVYFPSLEELYRCLNSEGGKQTAAHAVEISTGGAPVFLVSESLETQF